MRKKQPRTKFFVYVCAIFLICCHDYLKAGSEKNTVSQWKNVLQYYNEYYILLKFSLVVIHLKKSNFFQKNILQWIISFFHIFSSIFHLPFNCYERVKNSSLNLLNPHLPCWALIKIFFFLKNFPLSTVFLYVLLLINFNSKE